MTPKKCENCINSDFNDSDDGRALGRCVRYAPRPTTAAASSMDKAIYPMWPTIHADDICGEYVAKPATDSIRYHPKGKRSFTVRVPAKNNETG